MTRYRCTRRDPSAGTVIVCVLTLLGIAYLLLSIVPALLGTTP